VLQVRRNVLLEFPPDDWILLPCRLYMRFQQAQWLRSTADRRGSDRVRERSRHRGAQKARWQVVK